MAVFTAYVRLLGGSLGMTQHFIGPMAKQHRMFTLTLVTLLAAVESMLGVPPRAMLHRPCGHRRGFDPDHQSGARGGSSAEVEAR